MDRMKQLPEITDHILSGLQADDRLKHHILLTASTAHQKDKQHFRTVVSMCSLCVLLILLCLFATTFTGKSANPDLQNIPAGSRRNSSPVNLQTVIDKASDLLENADH